MSAPAIKCPACQQDAVLASSHRCHECRSPHDDDHDPWCARPACSDPGCEDWTWRLTDDARCLSCGVAVRVVEVDDDACEIELAS